MSGDEELNCVFTWTKKGFWDAVTSEDCPFIFPQHEYDDDHEHDSHERIIAEASKCEAGTLDAAVELDMLASALAWLSKAAAADPGMHVAFDSSLTKTQRAVVHRLVEQRFSKHLDARSTGTGNERCIGVWPKGAAPGTMVQEEHRQQAKRLYRIFRDAPEVAGVLHGMSVDELSEYIANGTFTEEMREVVDGAAARQVRAERLTKAARHNNVQLIQAIEAEYPGAVGENARNIDTGDLPLTVAARFSSLDALRTLIELGANVEAKDGRSKTALQIARHAERTEAEAILLQAGAHDPYADHVPVNAMTESLSQLTLPWATD